MSITALVTHHLFTTGLIAFCLLSNLVDAMKRVAPKPTDRGLYAFWYTFVYGLAGNALSAVHLLLKVFFPQNEKVLEECGIDHIPAAESGSVGAVVHDPLNSQ